MGLWDATDDMVANSEPSCESDLSICAARLWYGCLSLDRFSQIAVLWGGHTSYMWEQFKVWGKTEQEIGAWRSVCGIWNHSSFALNLASHASRCNHNLDLGRNVSVAVDDS